MVSINTKQSVLGWAVESVEGTPVLPQSVSGYIAMRDDWDFSPAFDTLDNEERQASIGRTKPIIGAENPTASGSHYLRGSGVEGQAPAFGPFLKAFFGNEVIAGTEYSTTSGSTTTVLKLTSAQAANFQRGQGLLIKDGVNGHRIRAVHTSDDLTDVGLSFAVPTAPGSAVALGKSILYSPANDSHQTLTLWHFIGNGGNKEFISGVRCTGFSFDANAKELLDASFDFEGKDYYYDGIQIATGAAKIRFTDDDGAATANVPVKWYKDPHELAVAITAALNSAATNETHTCVYIDGTGKFKFTATGTVLSLTWSYQSVANVQTVTFPTVAGATAGDFIVLYDHLDRAWGISLDKTGSNDQPTSAVWTAIPAARKVHVDISGDTSAADVAASVETAFDLLTGVASYFATDDTAADGTLEVTNAVEGAVTDSVVSNANGSGAGSITVADDTVGLDTSTIAQAINFDHFTDLSGTAAGTGYSSNAQDYSAPHTPTYDDSDPLTVKYHEVMFGEQAEYQCFDVDTVSFSASLERRIRESICEESGNKSSSITGREGELTFSGELQKYEAKNFNRYREGSEIRFQYSFGPRIGGNWTAGKSGCLYIPNATISSFEISEDEGVATFEITIQPFVKNGLGEMYMNFV